MIINFSRRRPDPHLPLHSLYFNVKIHHPEIGLTVSYSPEGDKLVSLLEDMHEPTSPAVRIVSNNVPLSSSLTSTSAQPLGIFAESMVWYQVPLSWRYGGRAEGDDGPGATADQKASAESKERSTEGSGSCGDGRSNDSAPSGDLMSCDILRLEYFLTSDHPCQKRRTP
jgi:hypothetical protein